MKFEVKWDDAPDDVINKMYDKWARDIRLRIDALVTRYAVEIEAWMKTNAVWTDRTGNARQSLYADTQRLLDVAILEFGHGVEYGKWLELVAQGKYAVIAPALDHFSRRLWRDIQALMR